MPTKKEIKSRLRQRPEPRKVDVVFHGPAGSGKSMLALHLQSYLRDYARAYRMEIRVVSTTDQSAAALGLGEVEYTVKANGGVK